MCKNLLSFILNPAKHMREMNAWKAGPPPTLTSIMDQKLKALFAMREYEEGTFSYAFHKARYEALEVQYTEIKKYREDHGFLVV